MISSAEEFVMLRSSDVPDEYIRAANDSASDAIWKDVIARFPHMCEWVAHNKTISQEIIMLLSFSSDPNVRLAIAMKRRTPMDVLSRLAEDKDDSVRIAIVHHPKVSEFILRKMLDDPWDNIRRLVSVRLDTR